MNTRSAKAKGRNGQNQVRALLLHHFNELHPDDIKTAVMGESGVDIIFSPAAKDLLPIQIEVKRRKKMAVVKDYKQAKKHGNLEPVVFSREDRGEFLVTISAKYYMKLLKRSKIEEPDLLAGLRQHYRKVNDK